jgi:hypothetical protein
VYVNPIDTDLSKFLNKKKLTVDELLKSKQKVTRFANGGIEITPSSEVQIIKITPSSEVQIIKITPSSEVQIIKITPSSEVQIIYKNITTNTPGRLNLFYERVERVYNRDVLLLNLLILKPS